MHHKNVKIKKKTNIVIVRECTDTMMILANIHDHPNDSIFASHIADVECEDYPINLFAKKNLICPIHTIRMSKSTNLFSITCISLILDIEVH